MQTLNLKSIVSVVAIALLAITLVFSASVMVSSVDLDTTAGSTDYITVAGGGVGNGGGVGGGATTNKNPGCTDVAGIPCTG